jgi:hypothetical protein
LQGLGTGEGAAVLYGWSRFGPVRLSPAVLPWLAIVGLCLLKANRRPQAWLIGLPLAAVVGLAWVSGPLVSLKEPELRRMLQLLLAAPAFGWAAALLLSERLPRGQTLAGFMGLLVCLGALSLLALAARGDWQSADFLSTLCAVALPFVTFALAAAASLAGWSCRRGFTGLRFSLWLLVWLVTVWVAMTVPLVVLRWVSEAGELGSVLALAAGCLVVSLAMFLPFLALCLASPLYRQRLQGLVGAASAAQPQPKTN